MHWGWEKRSEKGKKWEKGERQKERKRKKGVGAGCRLCLSEPAARNRSLQTGLGSPKPGCLGWHPEGVAWPSTEPLGAAWGLFYLGGAVRGPTPPFWLWEGDNGCFGDNCSPHSITEWPSRLMSSEPWLKPLCNKGARITWQERDSDFNKLCWEHCHFLIWYHVQKLTQWLTREHYTLGENHQQKMLLTLDLEWFFGKDTRSTWEK